MKPTPSTVNAAAVMTAAGVALTMAEGAPATRRITLSAKDAFEQGMAAIGNATRPPAASASTTAASSKTMAPASDTTSPAKTPACPWLKLGGTGSKSQRVKKILHIDRPQASAAHLFLRGNCHVEINGQRLDLPERELRRTLRRRPPLHAQNKGTTKSS